MSDRLGEKSLDVLRIAEVTSTDRPDLAYVDLHGTRERLFKAACRRWSTNAVLRKFDDLARRGYIEFGVSPHTGWLTDKGREALKQPPW